MEMLPICRGDGRWELRPTDTDTACSPANSHHIPVDSVVF